MSERGTRWRGGGGVRVRVHVRVSLPFLRHPVPAPRPLDHPPSHPSTCFPQHSPNSLGAHSLSPISSSTFRQPGTSHSPAKHAPHRAYHSLLPRVFSPASLTHRKSPLVAREVSPPPPARLTELIADAGKGKETDKSKPVRGKERYLYTYFPNLFKK